MSNFNLLLTKIEAARMWGYFHKDWLLQIRSALREQLPDDYRIFVESEAVLISPELPGNPAAAILPDVAVARSTSKSEPHHSIENSSSATAAVVEVDEDEEAETHYLLIIRRAPENQLVAALELLSPSNKGLGNRWDRERHLRKRDEYLQAGISLLELDALRQGARDLPTALGRLSEFDRIAWTAYLTDGRRRYRGWGWNEVDPLPLIDWQIDAGHAPLINLQQTLAAAAKFNQWDELVNA